MDRWLKGDRGVDTGPVFEWLTDTDGKWHSAESFPLAAARPAARHGLGQPHPLAWLLPHGWRPADRRQPRRECLRARPPHRGGHARRDRRAAAPAHLHRHGGPRPDPPLRTARRHRRESRGRQPGRARSRDPRRPAARVGASARADRRPAGEGRTAEAADRGRYDGVLPAAEQRDGGVVERVGVGSHRGRLGHARAAGVPGPGPAARPARATRPAAGARRPRGLPRRSGAAGSPEGPALDRRRAVASLRRRHPLEARPAQDPPPAARRPLPGAGRGHGPLRTPGRGRSAARGSAADEDLGGRRRAHRGRRGGRRGAAPSGATSRCCTAR